MMGSFILFVLWLVGLIIISIELWGPVGSVNGNCQLYVHSDESTGASTTTLAWLEQNSICEWPLPRVEIIVARETGADGICRSELDSGMGFRVGRMRVPALDDDNGISSSSR